MRQFVVVAHDAPLDPDFSLSDLAGSGRLDLLCRCLNAALLTSHGIREDVRAFLVVRDEATIRFSGREIRHLHPDERSTAALIREALSAREDAVGHREVESTPGVYVSKRGLDDVLAAVEADGPVIQLHEDGSPVAELAPPASPTFVLSDHRDFTEAEAVVVSEHADERISLGPERIHADHAIAVAHNFLDTAGYSRY
ncbi:MAG TPA: tRNA (pseudouridine(54)-N(1))-methyltransferase TrmY [Halobacteriales archaeon]|nr:tRNA (pseudouridine(54)-N(1))-methyltransferase TrmY [Halobacteriales archaeon]